MAQRGLFLLRDTSLCWSGGIPQSRPFYMVKKALYTHELISQLRAYPQENGDAPRAGVEWEEA